MLTRTTGPASRTRYLTRLESEHQNGIVVEKNRGSGSASIVRLMMQYDPDQTWSIVRP